MKKSKLAGSKRRNSKASLRRSDSESNGATMRKHQSGTSSRQAAEFLSRVSRNARWRSSMMDTKRIDGFASDTRIASGMKVDDIIQRYSDLYDFAPIGYVSFDRSGRVVEINLTATQLFGLPRERMIGMPFMVFVATEDVTVFLHHLLRCRSSGDKVQTELRLKDAMRNIIHAELFSMPVAPSLRNGAVVYQTAIIDLTERRRSAEAQLEAARQQKALYDLSQRHQEASSLDQIYEAALDAILAALKCDRASILLYDQQLVMRFVASRGLSKKYRKAVEGHSPWKPDAKKPEPISIENIDHADISKSLKSTIRGEGIRAVAFIPLVSSETLIGKFMVYHDVPHTFSDNELKLATTIGQQVAQVIQHKRDEDAVEEKEAELESIVTQTPFMLTRCTRDLRYRYVSRAYAEMLGRTSKELAGKPIVQIIGKEGLTIILPYIEKVLKGQTVEYETEVPFQGVGTRWLHCVYTPDRDAAGNVIGWFASLSDVGLRKRAEAVLEQSKKLLERRVRQRTRELRQANTELEAEIERRKGLEGEILAVSDREQQRLGQELHDGLCQHLTAVAFMARSVALRLRNHRVIDASDIEKIAELVNNAAADTRELSRALHRVDVDAAGLIAALQDLVDREIWKTACRLHVRPSFHIENNMAAAHLYRIAREAVINANKHAQAREIVIKLEGGPQAMVMRVIDDGVGFSRDPTLKPGLGFHIMNYRAQLLGGRLKIECAKKGGTCVSCYVPHDVSRSHASENGTEPAEVSARPSGATVASDRTLRHLARARAANE